MLETEGATLAEQAAVLRGQRVRLPGESAMVLVDECVQRADRLELFVTDTADIDDDGSFRKVSLTQDQVAALEIVAADGGAAPEAVLAGLWTEWMLDAARAAASTVLVSTRLRPYPHQMDAVYGRMLPQPLLRFLLADEPGTGKTMMSGLWLREAQRLGLVKRALVVCPAHLVGKWQADFERFLGGGLREVTAETVRWDGLASTQADTWVVSLHLAAANPQVREALHPNEAGWDAVIFDEAHRMTPTAETFHRVGRELSADVAHALFLTATPHRGDERYFRELLHLVDPTIFPSTAGSSAPAPPSAVGTQIARKLIRPGSLHFLRRMKEDLVDYDSNTRLFREREAFNLKVRLNATERHFYDASQDIANTYFPMRGRQLAAMVYGKRAASSLHALACTLRRRLERMGTSDGPALAGDQDIAIIERESDDDTAEEQVTAARSLDARAERAAITELLADLTAAAGASSAAADANSAVSKWQPLTECLDEHGIAPGSDEQLVVFTEYADTAAWLTQMFTDAGYTARSYSGADSHADRAATRQKFEDGKFQVIVSTDAGNEGIDLQAAHVLVNWDIPWSLVRLEQRMGRIHRIGQDDKVFLYNLVALGTREGDVLETLLDRLIAAANELGGQMFDCLAAVMERARTSAGTAEQSLLPWYGVSPADSADPWPTVDELRNARDEYLAESTDLSVAVDTATADAARIDEVVARVNPVIVEHFLERALSANVIGRQPAPLGDGFYYLSANMAVHGWQLPPDLVAAGDGRSLVVTRHEGRSSAIAQGVDRAADAHMLGPSDTAFRALVEALRTRLESDMWRGAVLCDTASPDDYTLLVFESDITEGGSSDNPRHHPRHSTQTWLIAASADGSTRLVSWAELPNLVVPSDELMSTAKTVLHAPLEDAAAEAALRAACIAAEAERADREQRLSAWVAKLRSQLLSLPNRLTDHIADRSVGRKERQRIKSAVDARLAEAHKVAQVTASTPRRIGWARVLAGLDVDPADLESAAQSEAVSMQWVTEHLVADGWHVTDVHTQNRGYDLEARRGPQVRCVEVKGVAGQASTSGVRLTSGELTSARQHSDDYWLYVVDNCIDGEGSLFGHWQDPASVFRDSFENVTEYRLAGSALSAALGHQDGDL
ncbi:helicase-related protein [Candidatus Poriferisodalis sp.]|uniref:helicase-related protein n=1 Tax=Candidatus Poriferisodalis sp. TaxID=3101277 RepID=UPI003B01D88F